MPNKTTFPEIELFLREQYNNINFPSDYAKLTTMIIMLVVTLIIAALLYKGIKYVLRYALTKIARKSPTRFDDILLRNKFSRSLATLAPLSFIDFWLPTIFLRFKKMGNFMDTVVEIAFVIVIFNIFRVIIRSVRDYFKVKPSLRDKPIDSYIQVVNIFSYFIVGIILYTKLTGKDPSTFLTAIGATSAILLLVFKDSILGFIASIQISTNDIVRIGDWIEMEKFGANGHVTQITLTTVKVQNWDNTITTIPTYSLISDSFKNWRGMQHSGGRRIMRSIFIKMDSIRFLSESEIDQLKSIELIKNHLENKQGEINKYNDHRKIDKSIPINGRNLTNIGVYRQYIESYLQQHKGLHQPNKNTHPNIFLFVRQLEATPNGLPIQIYCFSKETTLVQYEHLTADLFDHIIASAGFFDIKIHQSFGSKDLPTSL